MFNRRTIIAAATLAAIIAAAPPAFAQDKSIVVASTTSTQDSGLFEYLLPLFKKKTGITVKVVAQGTGQALDTGRRGDADVVFVHAKSAGREIPRRRPGREALSGDVQRLRADRAEERSGRHQGHEGRRQGVPAPSRTRRPRSSRAATAPAPTSPNCGSGRPPASTSRRIKGPWYKAIGQGMGAALNTAGAGNAYVLSDRGTWIHFKNKGDLQILVEGDKRMFNQYGVMLVNPAKHPNVKKELGQQFIDYLISPEGQKDISNYKINGEQLFYPNANDHSA